MRSRVDGPLFHSESALRDAKEICGRETGESSPGVFDAAQSAASTTRALVLHADTAAIGQALGKSGAGSHRHEDREAIGGGVGI